MRHYLHKNYIELKSDRLLWLWSRLSGTGGNAKAGAFFPFIITTSKIEPDLREGFINHELIHFAQQKELLLVGNWLLWTYEKVYWSFWKHLPSRDAYLMSSTEQEAYDHMFELDYLMRRPRFQHLHHYVRNKPVKWESISRSYERSGNARAKNNSQSFRSISSDS